VFSLGCMAASLADGRLPHPALPITTTLCLDTGLSITLISCATVLVVSWPHEQCPLQRLFVLAAPHAGGLANCLSGASRISRGSPS